jgi:hypothetical protein
MRSPIASLLSDVFRSPFVGGGAAPIVSPLISIDANGWQADYNGTPPGTAPLWRVNEAISVSSVAGFDSVGGVTTRAITTSMRITRRVRDPGATTVQATKVGLSKKLPAGAVVPGVVNNSTQVSPIPIVNWISRHGNLIGNEDVVLQVVCGHYYAGLVPGEQIACAEFIITDSGVGSITKKTATAVALSGYSDQKTVYGYEVTVTAAEMATLGDGRIAYNCNVYPFVGIPGAWPTTSIARTTDSAARGFPSWKFAERYDIKDPTRRTTPPRCYLATGLDTPPGVDATGVWSDNDVTARANPFLTLAGALAAAPVGTIPAGAFLAAGTIDGCEVRARIGTFDLGGPATTVPQAGGRLILTRDTTVASRAQAVYRQQVAFGLRVGQTGLLAGCEAGWELKDASWLRSANVAINPAFLTNAHFINANMNFGAFNSAMANTNSRVWYWGAAISNLPAGSVSALMTTSGGAVGIMRGCTGGLNGCVTFGYNLAGNSFTNIGAIVPAYTALNYDNTTIVSNINSGDQGTT